MTIYLVISNRLIRRENKPFSRYRRFQPRELRHKDVAPTRIYAHLLNLSGHGVLSPLDPVI